MQRMTEFKPSLVLVDTCAIVAKPYDEFSRLLSPAYSHVCTRGKASRIYTSPRVLDEIATFPVELGEHYCGLTSIEYVHFMRDSFVAKLHEAGHIIPKQRMPTELQAYFLDLKRKNNLSRADLELLEIGASYSNVLPTTIVTRDEGIIRSIGELYAKGLPLEFARQVSCDNDANLVLLKDTKY
jgi:hypothetical protein